MAEGRDRTGWLILAATLLALVALLAWAWADGRQGPHEPAEVAIRVHYGPQDLTFFSGEVALPAGQNTALDALLAAAEAGAFDVVVSDAYWEPFVTSVGGFDNSGRCGWVFDVNGERSLRGAASTRLIDADDVFWYWACA